MFIPLHDANTLKYIRLQYVTIGLIAANVLVFLLTSLQDAEHSEAAVLGLGYIPAVMHGSARLPAEYVLVPENLTYLTYAFLHGNFLHLAGNMLFLWVFGDNVEDAFGHIRYLAFYLACAAAAAFVQGLVVPDSQAPLIGASGAVAGIVSAYLLLHPRVKVWILAFGRIPLRIPAFVTLALWIAFQFVMLVVGGGDEVAWAAHVGGIVAGVVLVLALRRRGVPLFDSEIVTPKAVKVGERPEAPVAAPANGDIPFDGPWSRR
jgi:membrane associated rhomboid family serine protease